MYATLPLNRVVVPLFAAVALRPVIKMLGLNVPSLYALTIVPLPLDSGPNDGNHHHALLLPYEVCAPIT